MFEENKENALYKDPLAGFTACYQLDSTEDVGEALSFALHPHRLCGIWGRKKTDLLWDLWLSARQIEKEAALADDAEREESRDYLRPPFNPRLVDIQLWAMPSCDSKIRFVWSINDTPYDRVSYWREWNGDTVRNDLAAVFCDTVNANDPRRRYVLNVIACTTEEEMKEAADVAKEALQIEPYAANSYLIMLFN